MNSSDIIPRSVDPHLRIDKGPSVFWSVRQHACDPRAVYRRYSDDFVIVLPETRCNYVCVNQIKNQIISKSENDLFLNIESSKTKLLHFVKDNRKVYKDNTTIATTRVLNY